MTTEHEATIQDASSDLWRLAGSDLFVLADRTGRVVALHTASPGLTREMAQQSFADTLSDESSGHWWFGGQHLYEVFLRPIYFGPAAENRLLGFLVIGYEIDDRVASQVGRIAASQVAFYYGDAVVKTTLTPVQEAELDGSAFCMRSRGRLRPGRNPTGRRAISCTSLELCRSARIRPVRLNVLKSYDQATAFLDSLNRLLLALGLAAVCGGSALVFFISHTFTRPLGNLVEGVRALEKGDFTYALDARGGDEVAEVTRAFNRMRDSLQQNATGTAGSGAAGHHRPHGQFDLARFAPLAGGDRGQRGIPLRKPVVLRSARRALSGSSSRGEPDDRSDRLTAGIFAHSRILAADLWQRQGFGRACGCTRYARIPNFTRSVSLSARRATVPDGLTQEAGTRPL